MGRINPPPAEVSNGATAAAVGQQHRAARARETNERARLSGERLDAVVAWVRAQPSLLLDGEPCPDAIVGALWLRAHVPAGTKTSEMVRRVQRFREGQLDKDVRQGRLTGAEATARLAGHRLASEDQS